MIMDYVSPYKKDRVIFVEDGMDLVFEEFPGQTRNHPHHILVAVLKDGQNVSPVTLLDFAQRGWWYRTGVMPMAWNFFPFHKSREENLKNYTQKMEERDEYLRQNYPAQLVAHLKYKRVPVWYTGTKITEHNDPDAPVTRSELQKRLNAHVESIRQSLGEIYGSVEVSFPT